jgi:hypothetical protein
VGRVGRVGFPGFPNFIPGFPESGTGFHGLDGSGQVGTGLARVFFKFFLPTPVLDPPVLTGHRSDEFENGSDRDGSRPQVERVGFDPDGLF